MIFVDTNYFLRFLLNDQENQYSQAVKLFESAANGEIKLFTSIVVVFETYWVLSSFYKKRKGEVAKTLINLLNMDFIDYENVKLLRQAALLFQQASFDLEDCYNIVYAKESRAEEFKTFDQKLASKFKQL